MNSSTLCDTSRTEETCSNYIDDLFSSTQTSVSQYEQIITPYPSYQYDSPRNLDQWHSSPLSFPFDTDSSYQCSVVSFRGSIVTKLPYKTDPRRSSVLQTENSVDLIINIKKVLHYLREIRVELTLITIYQGKKCYSAFGFEENGVQRTFMETYGKTIRLSEVPCEEHEIIVNSVCVYKKKNSYFEDPAGQTYRLMMYPSRETLSVKPRQGLTTFIKENQLNTVRLAVRFFNASSNELLPIVGANVEENILFSNILSIEKNQTNSKKDLSQTKTYDTNVATTSTMNDDLFDAYLTANNSPIGIPLLIQMQPTTLQGDPVLLTTGEQEQKRRKTRNPSPNALQQKKRTRTESVDLGRSENSTVPSPFESNATKKRKTAKVKQITVMLKDMFEADDPIPMVVSLSDQILTFKYRIFQLWNIPIGNQSLILPPQEQLADEKTMEDYQIGDGALLFLDKITRLYRNVEL